MLPPLGPQPSQAPTVDPAAPRPGAWTLAEEMDNLADAIVRLHEELSLILELGDVLTALLDPARAADLILERVMRAIPASRGEIRLDGPPPVVFARDGGDDGRCGATQWSLATELRSAGERMGEVALIRSGDSSAFTSAEMELLNGLGAFAAAALHHTRLRHDLSRTAEALREREENLAAVLENVAEGILTVDEEGIVTSANPAALRLFGSPGTTLVGRPFVRLVPAPAGGDDADRRHPLLDAFTRGSGEPLRREGRGRRPDESIFPLDLTVSQMRRNGRRAWIVSVRDITEQKRWEEALRHQALHDALTGLPNRAQFASCLATLTGAATATGPLAVLLLDLDGFKEVNDTLGHQAGDGLLQQVGRRLVDATRAVDLVARLGGDEFGVLAPNAGKPGASAVARRILRALARPFEVDGRAVRVGVSLGVALGPAHGEDPVTLMKRADAAMYAAKRGGGGYRVHAPDGEARPNQSP